MTTDPVAGRKMPRAFAALVLLVFAFVICPAVRAETNELPALMRQITELARQGKFAEALPLAQQLVATAQKEVGRKHQIYATSLFTLAELHGLQGNTAKAERLHYRALQLREELHGTDHAEVAASLVSLANVYVATARYDDAETALANALRIRSRVLSHEDPDYGFTYVSLGRIKFIKLRLDEAGRLFEQALGLFTTHLAADHIYIPVALNNLAEVRKAQGRYETAEQLHRRALAINTEKYGTDSHLIGPSLNNLADLYRLQGRYEDAETLMRRHLTIVETALGPDHLSVATSLNHLALALTAQGRPREAYALLRRALDMQEKAHGDDHPDIASTLNNLADALAWMDRNDDAAELLERSYAVREKHFGPDHLNLSINLDNLASVLVTQERYTEAEPLLRRALAIRQMHLAKGHLQLAQSFSNLGVVLDNLGRHEEARGLHRQALDMRETLLGSDHPSLAISLNNLAANHLDEGEWLKARELFHRSNRIWIGRRHSRVARARYAAGGDQDVEFKRFPDAFLGFVRASFELSDATHDPADGARSDDAFQALQWALRTDAADAIAKMSARIAAGSGPLSALIRRQHDLASKALALDTTLLAHLSQPLGGRDLEAEDDLKRQIEEITSRSREIDAEMARNFPQHAARTEPAPLSISHTQQLLLPDEALYAIAMTQTGGFAWVVTATDARWVRVPLTRTQIGEHVAALRCGLDGTARVQSGAYDCSKLLAGASRFNGQSAPFDVARANVLYRALFDGVEDLIAGRKLLIVPSGSLASLPFHVLVTSRPKQAFPSRPSEYAEVAWLAKRHAIAVLPSVANLHALRRLAATSQAKRAFVGFGNPLLTGPGGKDRRAWLHQSCAKPSTAGTAFERMPIAAGTVQIRRLAVVESVRRQYPLPETSDELCRVAKASGADESMVFLGAKASEAKVKQLSAAGTLAQIKVVHFATHGLVAGETRSFTGGNAEPALILTPPESASEQDDGLLTASEIARLKLNADWVILSACNTAAGGSTDGEALSGLARAFFYAGARAALVSHWAVNSDATVRLITTMFDYLSANPDADRAEALRQAMLALMRERGFSAHPTAWAPFVFVGEGTR
jgi:CHAT domain-containing protein/tetratricopeptide (TPR) repeat protein